MAHKETAGKSAKNTPEDFVLEGLERMLSFIREIRPEMQEATLSAERVLIDWHRCRRKAAGDIK